MVRHAAILTALTLAALAPSSALGAGRAFTADDVIALRYASDPRISPDGLFVAYVVLRNDLEADEQKSRIFMASRDGEFEIAMTSESYSASDPRWSPDGRYLSFIATRDDLDENAAAQVYTLDRRGGEAEAYTDVPQGVVAHEWAPAGGSLALLIKDESATEKAAREAREAGDEEPAAPILIDRLQFKRDGEGYLDRSRAHIFVQEDRLDEPRQLTFGDFDDSELAWSPDGASIAFVSNRTNEPDGNANSDIFVVGLDAAKKPPRRLTDNSGADFSPAFSADGASIVHLSQTEPKLLWYASQHIAVVPATGGAARVLTRAIDRNFFDPRFAPDGSILALIEDSGAQPLASIDATTGAMTLKIGGAHAIYGFDVATEGSIAALLSTPLHPEEIFLAAGGALTRLSHQNDALLAEIALSSPIVDESRSADGTPIEAFYYPPTKGAMKRAPTILRIHGGPTSQFDYSFDTFAQLYAANGYLTVMANPRGSTGYGQPFAAAIFADWGVKDFDDVIGAVDHAIARGWADPKRLGVGGWSYGGMLTNYVITKSTRFDAAVTGASEANYLANYGHDHYQLEWELELGLPWETRDVWERISPFNQIDKVTTPTLVIGGDADWNVPILNSEQIYQALKRRGVPTGLVVYPGEDHSIDRPSFSRDRHQRYLDWYDKYVK